jgi:hypothetical protein
MDLHEMGWEGLDCIDVAQDRDRWRAPATAAKILKVPRKAGNFLSS